MKRIIFLALTLLCASAAFADMNMMDPVVAPDGTVLIQKTSLNFGGGMMSGNTNGVMQSDLVAVSTSGTVKWHFTGDLMISDVAFSGDKVIVLTVTRTGTDVVALRLADGVQAWKTTLTTFASGVTATSTQIYVTSLNSASMMSGGVMHGRPSASGPMVSMATTLTALNPASGVVLWTVTP